MNNQNESLNNKELFRLAFDTRNLEISLFWTRSNYFLVLCTAVTTGAFLNINDHPQAALFLTIFGFIFSVLWVRANLGSKFWQTLWEKKTEEYEEQSVSGTNLKFFNVTPQQNTKDVEEYLNRSKYGFVRKAIHRLILRKPSVSMQMIYLSLYFCLFFLLLATYSFFRLVK